MPIYVSRGGGNTKITEPINKGIDYGNKFLNLYTSGNEFYIGEPNNIYVGFYHIMDGKSMSGATHTDTSEEITAIDINRQQRILDTSLLDTENFFSTNNEIKNILTTDGTEFLLDDKSYVGNYIKVGLDYYTYYLNDYNNTMPDKKLTPFKLEPNFNNSYINNNFSTVIGIDTYRNIDNFIISEKKDQVISEIKDEINSIKLNIDFSDYKNFILFGSSVEQLYNFKLKISKLKKLRKNILELNNTTDSLLKYTLKKFEEEKEEIIQNFTRFEKYLFYENNFYYNLNTYSSTNISSSFSGSFTYLGKYSESFYYVADKSESRWENAKYTSSYYSGSLVNIHNKGINEFVSNSMIGKTINTQDNGLWIGLYQKSSVNEPSGGWVWLDENVLSNDIFDGWKGYTNWDTSNPNNSTYIQNYGLIYRNNGYWDDYSGSYQGAGSFGFSYILEITPYSKFNESYFENLSYSSSLFDENNLMNLLHYLPSFMKEDNINYTGYKRMVNMYGEYFDTLWLYIKNISNRDIDDINSNEYIPYQLLPTFLNQYNLYFKSKFEDSDILKFLYNLDKGGKLKYSYDYSDKVYTEKLYRRLLHSAPYILKSKGTKKSILSILNSYGISEEYIDINETNINKKLDPYYYDVNKQILGGVFTSKVYYLQFKGDQKVKLNWVNINSQKPDSIEVRFKTNHNSGLYLNHILFEKSSSHGNFFVTLNTTGSKYGNSSGIVKLIFKSGSVIKSSSTDELPIFNDIVWNLMLRRSDFSSDVSQSYSINLNQFKFKKFNFTGSCSVVTEQMTNLYNNDGHVYIGGSSSFSNSNEYGYPYYGDLNEFRMWNEYLSNDIFNKHSKAISTYFGKYDTSSFTNLVTWLKFEQDINHYSTSSVWDYNLAGTKNHGTASNFESGTNDTNYVTFYEEEIIGENVEKVNILDEQPTPLNLNPDTRILKSSKELLGKIDNKLSIYLSTNTIFNKDLMRSVNDFDIDNYVGDYRDYYKDNYESLDNLKKIFIDKFNLTGSFNIFNLINYIKYFDLSFFKLIEENIPYKTDYKIGAKIEQNKLERNKIYSWKKQNKSEILNKDTIIKYHEFINFKLNYENIESLIKYNNLVNFNTDYKNIEGLLKYDNLVKFSTEYKNIFGILNIEKNYVNSTYINLYTSSINLKEDRLEGNLIGNRQDHPFKVINSNGDLVIDTFKSKRNRFDWIYSGSTQTQINPISDIKKLPKIYKIGVDDRYNNAYWSINYLNNSDKGYTYVKHYSSITHNDTNIKNPFGEYNSTKIVANVDGYSIRFGLKLTCSLNVEGTNPSYDENFNISLKPSKSYCWSVYIYYDSAFDISYTSSLGNTKDIFQVMQNSETNTSNDYRGYYILDPFGSHTFYNKSVYTSSFSFTGSWRRVYANFTVPPTSSAPISGVNFASSSIFVFYATQWNTSSIGTSSINIFGSQLEEIPSGYTTESFIPSNYSKRGELVYDKYHINNTINRFKFNNYEGTINYDNPVETIYKNRKKILVVNKEEGKPLLKVE